MFRKTLSGMNKNAVEKRTKPIPAEANRAKRRCILALYLVAASPVAAQFVSQPVAVSGPSSACPGQLVTYFVSGPTDCDLLVTFSGAGTFSPQIVSSFGIVNVAWNSSGTGVVFAQPFFCQTSTPFGGFGIYNRLRTTADLLECAGGHLPRRAGGI